MGYTDNATDGREYHEALRALRNAALRVRECPYCTEGWRPTNGGFTRCECWEGYKEAFQTMCAVAPRWLPDESVTNLKSLARRGDSQ